jgi:transcriptional regulator GlxA family with amidase domain
MTISRKDPVEVLIVAVPETAGSALYGMLDVLLSAGNIWQTLVRTGSERTLFQVRIVSPAAEPFACGNGIPVVPDCSVAENPGAGILILPELWLGPDEDIHGRYPELMDWIRRRYKEGSALYSACSGSIMLAETGLLDGCEATSHWGYQDLFSKRYPKVRFRPEPNLVFADATGRIS